MSKISAMSVLNLVVYNMDTDETDPETGDPNGLQTAVGQFADGLSTMNVQLNPSAAAKAKDPETLGFDEGVAKLVDGSNQLKAGLKKVYQQRGTLASGVQQLTDGLNSLNVKAPKLSSGVTQLLNGSGQLSNGLDQLNGQVPTLASGVNKLADGSKQVDTGAGQLSDGLNQLNSKVPASSTG